MLDGEQRYMYQRKKKEREKIIMLAKNRKKLNENENRNKIITLSKCQQIKSNKWCEKFGTELEKLQHVNLR